MGGRKLLTSPKTVIDETTLAADHEGQQTQCEQLDLVTYDVAWVNGAGQTAEIVIQKSNDGFSWIDLYSINPIAMNTPTGDHQIDIPSPNCKYIRPKMVVSAGTLDVTVSVKGTTVGA